MSVAVATVRSVRIKFLGLNSRPILKVGSRESKNDSTTLIRSHPWLSQAIWYKICKCHLMIKG